VDDSHNTFGSPFKRRDDFCAGYQRRRMASPPFYITSAGRAVIEATITEVCNVRNWELLALNVRTNHVHVVCVAACPPEKVLHDLKSYTTRALRRSGVAQSGVEVWSTGGSTLYAWSDAEADRFFAYTLDAQGDDLPGSGWRKDAMG
jgi:REP element-mobilizing transposase RayT